VHSAGLRYCSIIVPLEKKMLNEVEKVGIKIKEERGGKL
jgi:hypothetical protein